MPIFEFQCRSCGHRFDLLQKASDPPPGQCPQCRKAALEKCLSAPGFQLRGAGWRKGPAKPVKEGLQRVRRIGHTLDSAPPHRHDDSPRDRHSLASPPGDHGHKH
jgi:putative FmdB family regulatory protein